MQTSKNIPRISISITNKPNYNLNQQKGYSPLSIINPKINIVTNRNNKSYDNNNNLYKSCKKNQYDEQFDHSYQNRTALTSRNQNYNVDPLQRRSSFQNSKNNTPNSTKVIAMNRLKPCIKPSCVNSSKQQSSIYLNVQTQRNNSLHRFFKPQTPSIHKSRIYQQDTPNTLKIINEKLRSLKLSQSIQPINLPYREKSSENESPTNTAEKKYSLPSHNIPHLTLNLTEQLQNSKRYSDGFIKEQSEELRSSNQSINKKQRLQNMKNYMQKYNQALQLNLKQQKQIQMQKQIMEKRQKQKQAQLLKKQMQAKLSKQLINQKQNKKTTFPFFQIRDKFYQNQNILATKRNIETEAEKCERITLIYEPFSTNLSSNHKSKQLPPQKIHTQTNNPAPQLTTRNVQSTHFQDQDKWDKIVKERQKIYNNQPNFSPLVNYYYNQNRQTNNYTNMKVKNQLISGASTDIKNITEPFQGHSSNNQRYRGSLKDQIQKQQSQTYSNSYAQSIENEPSCEYSFVESGSPLKKWRIAQYNPNQDQKQKQVYQQQKQQDNLSDLQYKIQIIANYYNKKQEEDKNIKTTKSNINNNIKNVDNSISEASSGRIKYSQPKLDPFLQKNLQLNLDSQQDKSRNLSDMKYSYSFSQQKQSEYQYEKQIFSKFLHCAHIDWMLIYSQMINVVENYDQGIQFRRQDQDIDNKMITYVKIGDSRQSLQQNKIIAHYIGIWLLSMGYDDPQVKNRVISNVQLMFMDIDDVIAQDTLKQHSKDKKKTQEQSKDYNIRNITQLMYNNLLHEFLPQNLHIAALLQICRRGWQYFTFLIYKIMKILVKHNRKIQKSMGVSIEHINHMEFISDKQLFQKLEATIKE